MTLRPFQGLSPLSLHNGASLGHYLCNNLSTETQAIIFAQAEQVLSCDKTEKRCKDDGIVSDIDLILTKLLLL